MGVNIRARINRLEERLSQKGTPHMEVMRIGASEAEIDEKRKELEQKYGDNFRLVVVVPVK